MPPAGVNVLSMELDYIRPSLPDERYRKLKWSAVEKARERINKVLMSNNFSRIPNMNHLQWSLQTEQDLHNWATVAIPGWSGHYSRSAEVVQALAVGTITNVITPRPRKGVNQVPAAVPALVAAGDEESSENGIFSDCIEDVESDVPVSYENSDSESVEDEDEDERIPKLAETSKKTETRELRTFDARNMKARQSFGPPAPRTLMDEVRDYANLPSTIAANKRATRPLPDDFKPSRKLAKQAQELPPNFKFRGVFTKVNNLFDGPKDPNGICLRLAKRGKTKDEQRNPGDPWRRTNRQRLTTFLRDNPNIPRPDIAECLSSLPGTYYMPATLENDEHWVDSGYDYAYPQIKKEPLDN